MSLHLDDARDLVEKIFAMRSRNTINACSDAQIQIQANYEDVITLALVHIGDADVEVRTTAYKLLNFLISTLNLPIKAPIQVKKFSGTSTTRSYHNGKCIYKMYYTL